MSGLLSGCPLAKEEGDGGASNDGNKDAGTSTAARDTGTGSRDAGSVMGDAGGGEEQGSVDAGANDAGVAKDAGSVVDSGSKDAGPRDPATPGSDEPTLSAVGYYDDDMGLRILLKGRDPNGDVASYTVKFFNGLAPVSFDIDNDEETPSVSTFTGTLVSAEGDAAFFASFEPTREFADAVDTIKVTVSDAGGRTSTEVVAKRGVPPATSSACDPLGFNRCTANNVCTKAGTAYRCSALTTARAQACAAAPVLNASASSSMIGQLTAASLWDTPASCASNDPKFKPDTIVKLRLTSPASKVTLSTVSPVTDFDTALYLLTTCTAQPAACEDENCTCSDDVPATRAEPGTNRSLLVLRNLPAGDHLIVVDSFPSADMSGDTFELSVSVE